MKKLLNSVKVWGRKSAKLINGKFSNSSKKLEKKTDNCWKKNINKKVVDEKRPNPVNNWVGKPTTKVWGFQKNDDIKLNLKDLSRQLRDWPESQKYLKNRCF